MKNYGLGLIDEFSAEAKQTFTLEEAVERLQLPQHSVLQILSRLKQSQKIVPLTSGLYALVHPSEKKHGVYPLPLIDALMKFRKQKYYVGLLSAADYWGAAHQKPMALQIVIPKQASFRKGVSLNIQFYSKKNFPSAGIVSGKTAAGYFSLSSPALTALDVISYEQTCGGFSNACWVVRDLIDRLVPEELMACAQEYKPVAAVQRLGYLLEAFGAAPELLLPLKQSLKQKKPSRVLLLASQPREGKTHPDWRVVANTSLEEER